VSEPTWRLLGQRVRSLVYLTVILTVASSTAQALNPARAITQYVHTVWNRDQGVPAGIYDMAQDHNGFIWLASRNGLFRFDGQTFERVDSATSSQQKLIFTLTATRDGSMWIGWGLAVYRNGSIKNVPDAGDGSPIIRIVQTRDGTMWAAAGGRREPRHALAAAKQRKVHPSERQLGLTEGSVNRPDFCQRRISLDEHLRASNDFPTGAWIAPI
jgi:ligand-binding sensor domain-containing protein